MEKIPFVYNDGGREAAGFKGNPSDCVTRAIAITTGLPYKEVYNQIKKLGGRSPRDGVFTKDKWFQEFMVSLGFEWIATMKFGTGCQVHLCAEELPQGPLICRVTKHCCAVVDGVLHDKWDCSRHGTRCVYGYWKLK